LIENWFELFFEWLRRQRSTDPLQGDAATQGDVDGRHRQTDEYARLLLAEAREELGRADQKASLLLAAASVAIAAIVTGLVGSGWKPSD
jgi:hypothetical protein